MIDIYTSKKNIARTTPLQVSVYHVANCKRIRTMFFPGRGDFVTCCFSGDAKWLVTAGTEPESSIVVWNWDKEKVVNSHLCK